MPNKWSPEPWFERSDAPINLTAANYDRARECVNALAGVADPAEDRAVRVEFIEAARKTLAALDAMYKDKKDTHWADDLRAAIARAEKK